MPELPPGDSALVLLPGSPRPAPEIGRVLAYHLGLHPTDAIARVRYSGGVLLSGIAHEVAEELRARLEQAGVQARRVPASLLRDLPRGHRVRSIKLLPGGIQAALHGGGERAIGGGDLFAVHLYALPDPSPSSMGPRASEGLDPASAPGRLRALPRLRTITRLPQPVNREEWRQVLKTQWYLRHHHGMGEALEISPRARKLREALLQASDPPPSLHLTLLCGSGIGPLRLLHGDLDYSRLGERKQPHSLDNFLLLLDELRGLAPGAWLIDRVAGFLDRLDPAEVLYFKPEEGQNLERWLLLWIRLTEEGMA